MGSQGRDGDFLGAGRPPSCHGVPRERHGAPSERGQAAGGSEGTLARKRGIP